MNLCILPWHTVSCDFCGCLKPKQEMIEHQGHYFCDQTELENLRLRNAAHSGNLRKEQFTIVEKVTAVVKEEGRMVVGSTLFVAMWIMLLYQLGQIDGPAPPFWP